MTIKPITTPLGQSLPPFTPHAITAHLPGWDTALRFRDGDPEIGRQLKSMYPRFSPLSLVKEVCILLVLLFLGVVWLGVGFGLDEV